MITPFLQSAQSFLYFEKLVQAIAKTAKSGDHILVMSNGSFGGIHQKILDSLG